MIIHLHLPEGATNLAQMYWLNTTKLW